MKLNEYLLKSLNREYVIYDKNERIIACGMSSDLFNMLGYFFLELEVIRTNRDWIYVDFKLGSVE